MQFVWLIATLIISYALTAIITPHPQNTIKPGTLQDFDFPQFDEGTAQAVYFGDCWTTGWMVLWYGNLKTDPIKSKSGKK